MVCAHKINVVAHCHTLVVGVQLALQLLGLGEVAQVNHRYALAGVVIIIVAHVHIELVVGHRHSLRITAHLHTVGYLMVRDLVNIAVISRYIHVLHVGSEVAELYSGLQNGLDERAFIVENLYLRR